MTTLLKCLMAGNWMHALHFKFEDGQHFLVGISTRDILVNCCIWSNLILMLNGLTLLNAGGRGVCKMYVSILDNLTELPPACDPYLKHLRSSKGSLALQNNVGTASTGHLESLGLVACSKRKCFKWSL